MRTVRVISRVAMPVLAIAAAVFSSAQGSGTVPLGAKFLGTGAPVKAKVLNTNSFTKQINPGIGIARRKGNHLKFVPSEGAANSLPLGGTADFLRVASAGPSFPAVGSTGAEPPDPDLAVGPNHIINVVNSDIAVFNKSGGKLLQQSFQQFFQSVGIEAFDFDPKVIYDKAAGKFVVVHLGLRDATDGTSSVLIAVSKTSSALGEWFLYKVDAKQTVGSNSFWLDYPGVGFNKDTFAVSGNMFGLGNAGYNGIQILAFAKESLYNGTATPSKFSAEGGTLQFAKGYDTTANAVYAAQLVTTNALRLTALSRTGSAFAVTQTDVPVPSFQIAPPFVKNGSNYDLDTLNDRVLVAFQRDGRLAATHAVRANTGGAATRWYDFRLNNWPVGTGRPTLTHSGTIQPPSGTSYFMPSVAIDRLGSLAVVMNRVGSNAVGDTLVSARKFTDPVNTISSPTVLERSPNNRYVGFGNRWGDYLDTEVDPADDLTFWTVGMGANAQGHWLTLISKFKVSNDTVSTITPASVSVNGGTLVGGNLASLSTVDGVQYNIRSASTSGVGQVAGFLATFNYTNRNIEQVKLNFNFTAPQGASVLVFARNVANGQYEQLNSIAMTGTAVSRTIDISAANINRYVATNGQMQIAVRSVLSGRGNPAQYIFGTDLTSSSFLRLQ